MSIIRVTENIGQNLPFSKLGKIDEGEIVEG